MSQSATREELPDGLPLDVAAYLEQATKELIAEQPAVFKSREEFGVWLAGNTPAVVKRANELQQELCSKVLDKPDVLRAVSGVTMARVWGAARVQEINKQVARETRKALA
jgi:hypothetical protein